MAKQLTAAEAMRISKEYYKEEVRGAWLSGKEAGYMEAVEDLDLLERALEIIKKIHKASA